MTFQQLKKGLEDTRGKDFTAAHLAELVAVSPALIEVKWTRRCGRIELCVFKSGGTPPAKRLDRFTRDLVSAALAMLKLAF